MDPKLTKIVVTGTGVTGLALLAFWYLLDRFHFQFAQVPASWSGPIATLFILVVGGVITIAIVRSKAGQRPEPISNSTNTGRRANFVYSHVEVGSPKEEDRSDPLFRKEGVIYLRLKNVGAAASAVEIHDGGGVFVDISAGAVPSGAEILLKGRQTSFLQMNAPVPVSIRAHYEDGSTDIQEYRSGPSFGSWDRRN